MHPPIIFSPDADGRAVVVSGAKITRVGDGALTSPSGGIDLDCTGAKTELGAINAHTHLYSGLAPLGMPPPEPAPENFVQILERVWWRLDRALDEASLRAAARYYVAESLLAGTTTLIDHHESPAFIEGSLDVLASACADLGVRALLCYGATERNDGSDEGRRGLAECQRFLQSDRKDTIAGAVALHASFTVSDETIAATGAMCRELGAVLHLHVAEDGADVEDAKGRGYAGVIDRLLRLDALPKGSILAHGVHLTEDEVMQAVDRGCWFVQNPRSNANNRVGYATARGATHTGALGTDGFDSVMTEETKMLEKHGEREAVITERAGAARHLVSERFDAPFVALAPGAAADLVVRDGEGVRHVVVGGRVVVRDRRLVTADIEEIRSVAKAEATRLWARMKAL